MEKRNCIVRMTGLSSKSYTTFSQKDYGLDGLVKKYLEQKEISDKKHARGSADLQLFSCILKDFPLCSDLLNV